MVNILHKRSRIYSRKTKTDERGLSWVTVTERDYSSCHFDDEAQRQTVRMVRFFGLDVLRIINEPTGANMG